MNKYMAQYAIGDIQGCLTALKCLLQRVNFQPQQDELWIAGDIVNRGPHSLATLQYLYQLDQQHQCLRLVLGNHDLHLLATGLLGRKSKPSDTLDDILFSDDRDTLLQWLRQWPLAYHQDNWLMVHAGIHPDWSIQTVLNYSQEVSKVIRGPDHLNFFEHMYGNTPLQWHDHLVGMDRLRSITNYLTRMRYCNKEGMLDLKNKQAPSSYNSKNAYQPWFKFITFQTNDTSIIFGHWASLKGKCETEHIYALDTGCVWGGKLTMIQLDTKEIFSCDC